MTLPRSIVAVLALLACSVWADDERLLFTGDILLSRLVAREMAETGRSPWQDTPLSPAALVLGNLEGAIGSPEQCADGKPANLCFAVDANLLSQVRAAGFNALGNENNHAGDLGPAGRLRTEDAVVRSGMLPVNYETSPRFFQVGSKVVGVVAINRVAGRDGVTQEIERLETRQKIHAARQLAHWVVAYIHWGNELVAWPTQRQYGEAKALLSQGVDLIVGHHPHVVQAPICLDGRPVFFSLGNHLFDQKYEATRKGLMAECVVRDESLVCRGIATNARRHSTYPEFAGEAAAGEDLSADCRVTAGQPLEIGGVQLAGASDEMAGGKHITLLGLQDRKVLWRVPPRRVRRLLPLRLTPDAEHLSLLTVEDRYSDIDKEVAPRIYVYRPTPEGLEALWRGSALAWPLLDAHVMRRTGGGDELCALHRGDSFLVPQIGAGNLRTMAYRWNGFGFSAAKDASSQAACKSAYAAVVQR